MGNHGVMRNYRVGRDRRFRRHCRSGLTLVELLVVVAVIAILATIILPAIMQARSAARRTQCGSNLKQLAQAVQGFHERMGCLPVYWGSMRGGNGEKFGGWLLHLLPDLDQQALFDAIPPEGTLVVSSMTITVPQITRTSVPTGRTLPAIPASADYNPGQWVETVTTNTVIAYDGSGNAYPLTTSSTTRQLVGARGEPGRAGGPEMIIVETITGPPVSVTISGTNPPRGVSPEYGPLTASASVPMLVDAEDPSPLRSPAGPSSNQLANSPLTNYLLNAHVFTRFSGPRVPFGQPNAGFFPEPLFAPIPNAGPPRGATTWDHVHSGNFVPQVPPGHTPPAPAAYGPMGRRLEHVTDGLTNTIIAAEAMRQCDAFQVYRYAFFPTGPSGAATPFNEHGFGILPSLRSGKNGEWSVTRQPLITARGNTLMFQTQPRPQECNKTRVQALHGNFLMTAMADGSVRAISSLVERREPIGVTACGRLNFGTTFFGSDAAGAGRADITDGVWDMLMLPSDGGVLANTGEIGREK